MENYNEKSELLNLLIDGELEEAQETPLFSELSQNEGLRQELRELLAIRESVRNDTEAFTPPPAATSNVFATLGIENPAVTSTVSGGAGIASTLRKIWIPAAAAIVATLFTTFFVSDIYEDKIAEIKSNVPVISSDGQTLADAQSIKAVPVDKSESAPAASYMTEASNKPGNSFATPVVTPNTQETEDMAFAETEDKPVSLESTIVNASLKPFGQEHSNISSLSGRAPANMVNGPAAISINDFFTSNSGPRTKSLYAGGIAGNGNALDGYQFSLMLDNAFSLDNFSVGVMLGSEPFEFEYITDDFAAPGETVDRFRSRFWAGVAARYQIEQLGFAGAMPFVHTSVGSNGDGMMLKGAIGLQYYITGTIGISAGLDYSTYWYENKGTGFNTQKLGIIGGITYKF